MTAQVVGDRNSVKCHVPAMNKSLSIWSIATALFLIVSSAAFAQPTAFSYQGRLKSSSTPATGLYDFQLTIFDASASGSTIAGPLTISAVAVTNGLFTLTPDFGANVFTGDSRWLDIAVRTNGAASFSPLGTRQQILSSPYSITASNLSGTLAATKLTGTLTSGLLSGTYSGAVTFSNTGNSFNGAFTGNGNTLTNLSVSSIGPVGTFSLSTNFEFTTLATLDANGPFRAIAADVNADGKMDIVSVDVLDSALVIRTNDGAGVFTATQTNVLENPQGVVAGDLNNDGKIDLVSINYYTNSLSILTNDGTGHFVLAGTNGVGSGPIAVAITDVNGDGKPDLVTANSGSADLTVLTNNGTAGFALFATLTVPGSPFSVVAADINRDGTNDLISAVSGHGLSVLTNDGAGGFSLSFTISTPADHLLSAADFNGDGTNDLVSVGSNNTLMKVFINDGSGGFTEASSLAINSQPASLAVADFNGDGKPDVAIADGNLGALSFNTITVFTNNGSGTFSIETAPKVGSNPVSVAAADFNGDGRIDLVSAANDDFFLSVMARTPFVQFNSSAHFAGNGSGLTNLSVSAADLTGILPDGHLSSNVPLLDSGGLLPDSLLSPDVAINGNDVTFGNAKLDFLLADLGAFTGGLYASNFFGSGSGLSNINVSALGPTGVFDLRSFALSQTLNVDDSPVTTFADLNGDGSPDLISAAFSDRTVTILTNNGSGFFIASSTNDAGSAPYSVLAADVNNDTRIDLVVPNNDTHTLTVLTNDGTGLFVIAATLTVGENPTWVAAADINGDSLVDLISADGGSGTITVLTNDAGGNFVLSSTETVGDDPEAVLAADLDGDSNIDLVTADYGSDTLSVLINDGAGNFTTTTLDTGSGPFSVIAVDLDGDGSKDLVSADLYDNSLSVFLNDGSGGFSFYATLPVGFSPDSVAAADINGDGLIDLISANSDDNTLTLLVNDGFGNFSPYLTLNVGDGPYTVSAVDINGDSYIDLISANGYDDTLTVLTNSGNLAFTTRAIFTGNGGGLTNISATNLVGTISDLRLSTNVALLDRDQTFSGANTFSGVVTANNAGNQITGTFTGDGSALTSLNASQLTSGTVALARLPTAVVTNTQTGVTLSGTFSGDGSGLTSTTTSKNYAFAYDTTTQAVGTAGTFQDILFNSTGLIDGWVHTAGTASFTSTQTGLYLISCNAAVQTTAGATQSATLLAVLNGFEIPGSQWVESLTANSAPFSMSKTLIVSVTAGNVLKFQITGTSTSVQLITGTGSGNTKPSISCTITRIQ
jgi:hypothetical protein